MFHYHDRELYRLPFRREMALRKWAVARFGGEVGAMLAKRILGTFYQEHDIRRRQLAAGGLPGGWEGFARELGVRLP